MRKGGEGREDGDGDGGRGDGGDWCWNTRFRPVKSPCQVRPGMSVLGGEIATYLKGQGVHGFSRDFHLQGPPHKHRLPQISPQPSFFFFFLLLLPSQPPKPTEYTAIPQHQLPPPPNPQRCELHSSCSPLYSIWRFAKALALAQPIRQEEATNPNLDLNAALRYRDVTIIQT